MCSSSRYTKSGPDCNGMFWLRMSATHQNLRPLPGQVWRESKRGQNRPRVGSRGRGRGRGVALSGRAGPRQKSTPGRGVRGRVAEIDPGSRGPAAGSGGVQGRRDRNRPRVAGSGSTEIDPGSRGRTPRGRQGRGVGGHPRGRGVAAERGRGSRSSWHRVAAGRRTGQLVCRKRRESGQAVTSSTTGVVRRPAAFCTSRCRRARA